MQLFDRLCEQGGADEHNDRQSKLDDDETLANPKLRDDIFAFERAGHSRPERARGVVRVNVESGSEQRAAFSPNSSASQSPAVYV